MSANYPAAECDHRDSYGSTVLDGGHCILCNTTPRASSAPRLLARTAAVLVALGVGALIGEPLLGVAAALGMAIADATR